MRRSRRTRLGGRLAILFGAGATFGAGDVSPYPPPLGDGLFAELEANYSATWGTLPNTMKDKLRSDFEEGMADIWNVPELASNQLFIDMGATLPASNLVPVVTIATRDS